MRALCAQPAQRYQNAGQAKEALDAMWEASLKEGIISHESLYGKEMLHADAPKEMHPQPTSAAFRPPSLIPTASQVSPVLVIESNKAPVPDNAPTDLIVVEPEILLTNVKKFAPTDQGGSQENILTVPESSPPRTVWVLIAVFLPLLLLAGIYFLWLR